MPAAPVTRPMYDPSYDPGQPAIVSYALNFMGERSRINEQLRAERLKRADPTQYDKMIEIEMRSIAELQERKAKIQQNKIQGYTDISSDMVKAAGQGRAQQWAAYKGVKVAEIEALADMDRTFSEERKFRAELLNIPTDVATGLTSSLEAVGDTPATTPTVVAEQVQSATAAAITAAGGTASQRDAINYEAYQQIVAMRDMADAQGDAVEAAKYDQAIEYLRQQFPGGEPAVHMAQKYPGLSESEQREREAKVRAGIGPPQGTILDDTLTMMGGLFGGEPAGGGAAPGGAPADAGQPGGASAGPASTPAQRREAQQQGGGATGGVMGMLDAAVNPVVADIDADIAASQERLKRLLDKRDAASSMSVEEAFFGDTPNYLLGSPFRGRHKGQAVLDRIAELSPADREALFMRLAQSGSARRAVKDIEREGVAATGDARLFELDPGPHYDSLTELDAGEPVFRWMQGQLAQAAGELGSDDPAAQERGFARYRQVVGVAGSLPPRAQQAGLPMLEPLALIEENLSEVSDARSLATLLAPVSGVVIEDDVLFADLLAAELDDALAIEDPKAQVDALRQIGLFADNVPSDLGGRVGGAYADMVDHAVRTGDGRALYAGSVALAHHSNRIAYERREAEGPDAEAWAAKRDPRDPAVPTQGAEPTPTWMSQHVPAEPAPTTVESAWQGAMGADDAFFVGGTTPVSSYETAERHGQGDVEGTVATLVRVMKTQREVNAELGRRLKEWSALNKGKEYDENDADINALITRAQSLESFMEQATETSPEAVEEALDIEEAMGVEPTKLLELPDTPMGLPTDGKPAAAPEPVLPTGEQKGSIDDVLAAPADWWDLPQPSKIFRDGKRYMVARTPEEYAYWMSRPGNQPSNWSPGTILVPPERRGEFYGPEPSREEPLEDVLNEAM